MAITDRLLNEPKLVDLMLRGDQAKHLKSKIHLLKSLDLSERQTCDVEMLLNGAFSPLTGFMNENDYNNVCKNMRLVSSTLWPIPITLDIIERFANGLKIGEKIALKDIQGVTLAVLLIESIWKPDKIKEAKLVFGTTDTTHPGVDYLLNKSGDYYIGGALIGLEMPTHYDFNSLRLSPLELRKKFKDMEWDKVVAFQTRNPMHRAHVELTLRATKKTGAKLLINPVVGMTKPGDIDHYTRVRGYEKILGRYPESLAELSLLPLAMRMAGPREAIWHMIIRKNYGLTHFIVGRDHAGPGKDSSGKEFYGPYDAQVLAEKYAKEVGIEIVPFKIMVYLENQDTYVPDDEVPVGDSVKNISGTELRSLLTSGGSLPDWFTYSEIADELKLTYPSRDKQGLVIFLTGLSGSGKSTIANALMIKLLEIGGRTVSLLDGDIVRKQLSSELGFSKTDRSLNVRRVGYVASEISKHRGIAITALISPYDDDRKEVKKLVENKYGSFILVYLSTPIEICEKRDRKGLYAAARSGSIKEFTGISDPYEIPDGANIVINTDKLSISDSVDEILQYLKNNGYVIES